VLWMSRVAQVNNVFSSYVSSTSPFKPCYLSDSLLASRWWNLFPSM